MSQEPNKSTEAWYRSVQNRAISNSKAKLFKLNRRAYNERYNLGTAQDDPSDSMVMGSAVDAALTAGTVDAIHKRFIAATPKQEIADWLTRMPQAKWDTAMALSDQVLSSRWWSDLTGLGENLNQQVLYAKTKIGAGRGKSAEVEVCGIPDKLIIERNPNGSIRRITICEIKTCRAQAVESQKAWYWNATKMGYWQQLAVQAFLVRKCFKVRPNQIRVIHVALGTTPQYGDFPVRLMVIPRSLYTPYLRPFLRTALEIMRCTDWSSPEPELEKLVPPGGVEDMADDEDES